MRDKEQKENIERVSSRIGVAITEFWSERIGKQFHVEDLRKFVSAKVGEKVAPASPDRILRQLKQSGKVNYKIVSRRKSLYEALPVALPKIKPAQKSSAAVQQASLF